MCLFDILHFLANAVTDYVNMFCFSQYKHAKCKAITVNVFFFFLSESQQLISLHINIVFWNNDCTCFIHQTSGFYGLLYSSILKQNVHTLQIATSPGPVFEFIFDTSHSIKCQNEFSLCSSSWHLLQDCSNIKTATERLNQKIINQAEQRQQGTVAVQFHHLCQIE